MNPTSVGFSATTQPRTFRLLSATVGGAQAHSGVDVAGTSVVELVRCSILDTAATAGRAVDDSRMVLRLCHVAYGMSGLLAFDRASLEVLLACPPPPSS